MARGTGQQPMLLEVESILIHLSPFDGAKKKIFYCVLFIVVVKVLLQAVVASTVGGYVCFSTGVASWRL